MRPMQMCRTWHKKGGKYRAWYKRLLNKALRREAKKIKDPDADLHPKRRFQGWDD